MTIWGSLLTGSTGLSAFQDAIGVVGDNISNVSTTGYRASRATFEDVLGGTAANGQREGVGVKMGGPESLIGQGTLQQTSRSLDLAVRGHGMFILNGAHDGINGTYYTRDGRFSLDKDGNLVNPEGLHVQGYAIDAQGSMDPISNDIHLDPQGAPNPTANVSVAVNLDPNAAANASPTTSTTVYDSLGVAHRVDVTFTRGNAANEWNWSATVDGSELTNGAPGAQSVGSGTLTFNPDGTLQAVTPATPLAVDFVNATQQQPITLNFGDPTGGTPAGTGRTGTTQYGNGDTSTGSTTATSAWNVKSVTQDGYAPGTLTDVEVSDTGEITAKYSNGHTQKAARIALASFGAEGELERAGGQLFQSTLKSGEARVGAAATGQRGAVAGSTLEGSNVDLGSELVTLIAYQRAFQANAKTVTTSDEILNEVANIKR